jgi:hypothetical protein
MQHPLPALSDNLAGGTRIFERILVLVDFNASPRETVGAALELHRVLGSHVRLFEMPELTGGDEFLAGLGSPSVIGADLDEEGKGRLARFIRNVAPEYVDQVEVDARLDVDAISALKAEAKRWGPTLVIAAAESHGRLFLRSQAEKLVHGLDVPILVVPTRRDESATELRIRTDDVR